MAYREVTMVEVKEVLRLWLRGVRNKRIAARLGIDVKTVRRYTAAAVEAGLRREGGEGALSDEIVTATSVRRRPSHARIVNCRYSRVPSNSQLMRPMGPVCGGGLEGVRVALELDQIVAGVDVVEFDSVRISRKSGEHWPGPTRRQVGQFSQALKASSRTAARRSAPTAC